MGAHDPVADPLTTYWRELVERAASVSFGARLPPINQLRTSGLTDRQRDYLRQVEIMGSTRAAAAHFGVSERAVYRALLRARRRQETRT